MGKYIAYISLLVCLYSGDALNLPGPLVYVVTPSPRPPRAGEARAAPFYYHNWMRRMDPPSNASSTTTTTPKVETPDLIFAEFESGSGDNYKKSLRNLLEKEKIKSKTSTTATTKPIYVPDVPEQTPKGVNYGVQVHSDQPVTEPMKSTPDMTDYFALYNNLYNNDAAPVYLPSTTASTTLSTSPTTTSAPESNNVQDIWHVIDSEKHNQYAGKWEEVSVDSDSAKNVPSSMLPNEEVQQVDQENNEDIIDDNFALPGFAANGGNGAENESRAIRTEQNIRFPYINLKPFQIKNQKPSTQNMFSNSKKGNNNLYTNLDNFHDLKNPVRGEAHDVAPMRQPVDRYNPAQPYLPSTKYGMKQKDSSPAAPPMKSVANLVPPPPPATGNDFPFPNSYESFPPYAPADTAPAPAPAPAPTLKPPKPAVSSYQPQMDSSDDSVPLYDSPPDDANDDSPPMDLGYRYKPPAPPALPFVPTLPPVSKPYKGYSYDPPAMSMDTPPAMETSDFQGYNYNKPKPAAPPSDDHPPSPSYGHHGPSSYDSDYPELIFNKQHGNMDATKGGDDMKGNDMGMMPPPPPSDMKPDMNSESPSDEGFPHDFPGDFKYHHDFDDFYHHHHHHPTTTTTTTTTTEMPRVNRYSYYYLGKKLYYLPLYFSVYFIVYVGALIIKAVLRHKIVYPNSWRPNDQTAGFFSKRSIDSWDLSNENLHEVTGRVTAAIGKAAEKYMNKETKED